MKKLILVILFFATNNLLTTAQEKYHTYWDNQKSREIGYYLDGEKTGQWKAYYQNGKMQYIGNYNNGKKKDTWKYYHKNSQLSTQIHYTNGTPTGKRKDYHPNGKLRYVVNYNTKGVAIGESKTYDIKGDLFLTETYKNGEIYKIKYANSILEKFPTYMLQETEKQEIENSIGNNLKIKQILKTKQNTNYIYVFGTKEQIHNNKKINALTILLVKENKIISEISYNIPFEFMTVTQTNRIEGYNLEHINESLEMEFGRAACGYGVHNILFFRKGNSLIKGVLVSSYGEPESDYSYSEIIEPTEKMKNQIWIKKIVGCSKLENDKVIEIPFYTKIKKYKLQKDKLVLLNSKKNNYYYVTAKSGLRQRYQPFITSEKLDVLAYGTKIKLLNKTKLPFKVREKGKILQGYWANIETQDSIGNKYTSYVFDGYLSKIQPKMNLKK